MHRLVNFSTSTAALSNVSKIALPTVQKVSHCVFDMDGTLLDTETLYTQAFQKALDPFEKEYTWEVKLQLMGLFGIESAQKVVEIYNLPLTAEEFAEISNKEVRAIMREAELLPGAERLIRHLHEHNVPFCLATSSSKEMAEIKMSRHKELFDLFSHKVYGSTDPDVKIGKPAPDIFLVACKRFPDTPKEADCLVFEDAPNGVRAACLAGMQSVMIPENHVPEDMCQDATIVIKSLEDFQPELFGLPPFENQNEA